MDKIRIFLADDHGIVREGLKRMIDAESDLAVVGEASEGSQAIALCSSLLPDVVVMDISMPGVGGMQATRELRACCPSVHVLALTVHEDRAFVSEALQAGASGYVVKRAAPDDLVRAIRIVASGSVYIDPLVAGKLLGGAPDAARAKQKSGSITEREMAVLRRIARGFANKEIAAELNLSVKTIETYKARGMEKLGLKSRVDIVRLANELGWFEQS